MDLYLLNEIQKLKGGGVSSGSAEPMGLETAVGNVRTVKVLHGVSDRYYHQNYDWTSTINGNNYYVGGAGTPWFDGLQSLLFSTGSGVYSSGMSAGDNISMKGVLKATNNNVGMSGGYQWEGRAASNYGPVQCMTLAIRNPTSSDITKTVYNTGLSDWQDSYCGAGMWVYTPNAAGYSAVTSGTWTKPVSYSGQSYGYDMAVNVTVPAGKTVLVVVARTAYYRASYSYYSQFDISNHFYRLDELFDADGLECDLRMTRGLHQLNFNGVEDAGYPTSASISADITHLLYNKVGEVLGDR